MIPRELENIHGVVLELGRDRNIDIDQEIGIQNPEVRNILIDQGKVITVSQDRENIKNQDQKRGIKNQEGHLKIKKIQENEIRKTLILKVEKEKIINEVDLHQIVVVVVVRAAKNRSQLNTSWKKNVGLSQLIKVTSQLSLGLLTIWTFLMHFTKYSLRLDIHNLPQFKDMEFLLHRMEKIS